jgi:hypothetical protein
VVEVLEVLVSQLELLDKILFLTPQLLAHLQDVLLLQVVAVAVQTDLHLVLAGLAVAVFWSVLVEQVVKEILVLLDLMDLLLQLLEVVAVVRAQLV